MKDQPDNVVPFAIPPGPKYAPITEDQIATLDRAIKNMVRPELPHFEVGDLVRATAEIHRVDRRTNIQPGQTAKVIKVCALSDGTQIIDIDVGERYKPICSLVVTEALPLRKLARTGLTITAINGDTPQTSHNRGPEGT